MQDKPTANMGISYKNPFDDYNANVLTPELIMQYWYTPFGTGALKDLNESMFFSDKMPIILQGARGSGKTTLLKYFSFPVQRERAKQVNKSIRKQLKSDGGVGFYLRCDDSFLNTFKIVFSTVLKDRWLDCFKHYLELFFSKSIVQMIKTIGITEEETEGILQTYKQLGRNEELIFDSIESIDAYLSKELHYISKFKNEALFSQVAFSPSKLWDFYTLSRVIIQSINDNLPDLAEINYLLLIDEFENLPIDLQEMFNTLIKFCKPGMSIRVGRRSENESVVTKATVNDVEYLREGSDYRLIRMDYQGGEIKDLKPYLAGIAQKRLEAFKGLDISTDISCLLGEKENLDNECSSITNGRVKHLHEILKINEHLTHEEDRRNEIISIINCSDNILAVALCALWVARSEDDDLISAAHTAANAMNAFFQRANAPQVDKFANDYNNKYRYALTVLICSLYKKDKMYYGFNTICYLSEGNARTLINLIKAIISDALFYEKQSFLESGSISSESQNRAIKEYSSSEFNSVCSIIYEGKSVKNLILNIGNILSDYHKDKFVRYPETTQFIYNIDELSDKGKKIVNTAESWALINRRKEKQRVSAGIGYEGYLYSINRIFAPIFNISYRIRGGVNIVFTPQEIDSMLAGNQVNKLLTERKKKNLKNGGTTSIVTSAAQISFFDEGDNK